MKIASRREALSPIVVSRSEERGLVLAVLDALTSHICVLSASGTITLINEAWRKFALENTGIATARVSEPTMGVCRSATGPGAEEALVFAEGVRMVLEGRSELFQLEYPCHSPTEDRWFVGRVTPLTTSPQGAVVSHQNVTDRKRVEFELDRLPPPTPSPVSPIAATSWRRHRREVERVRRFDVPASVVMMDLDHFKAVNGTYGHAVGDEVLRLVAVTAKGCLRDIDVLARLGGGGVCPASTRDQLRKALRSSPRGCAARSSKDRSKTHLSSLPASAFPRWRLVTSVLTMGLQRADAALYAAKHLGRNRVVSCSDLLSRTEADA